MKKVPMILCLLVLAAGFGFARGQEEKSTKPVTLTFYHYATQTHVLYLNPIKEAFQKAFPNITLQAVEVTAGGYEALTQKILLGLASGEPVDIGQTGYDQLRTMVQSGNAVALDSFIASDAGFRKDNLFPAMMDLGRLDGRQWMVPIGTSTPAMYINMDLFKKVGLDPENPPKSWAEARAAAEKLKAAGHQGIFWGWQVTGNWIFQAMLDNLGGKLVNDAGTGVAFNDAKGLKVLEHLSDLVTNGLMPASDQGLALFVAGNLGMWIDSSFQRVNTPQQVKFGVRMAPIPTPEGTVPKVAAGGNGAMIFSKDPAKQKAAWQFIRWMTEEDASRIVADKSGYTPANQSVIRALTAQFGSDVNYKVTLDQAARVVPWYSWPGKNSNKIAKALRDMQEAVVLGKKTPKAAMDEAAQQVNALLK